MNAQDQAPEHVFFGTARDRLLLLGRFLGRGGEGELSILDSRRFTGLSESSYPTPAPPEPDSAG